MSLYWPGCALRAPAQRSAQHDERPDQHKQRGTQARPDRERRPLAAQPGQRLWRRAVHAGQRAHGGAAAAQEPLPYDKRRLIARQRDCPAPTAQHGYLELCINCGSPV